MIGYSLNTESHDTSDAHIQRRFEENQSEIWILLKQRSEFIQINIMLFMSSSEENLDGT